MDNWLGLFLLIVVGAAVNLALAFFVLRALARAFGIPDEVNTPSRALQSLVTIMPVAGVAGAPFFIIPFIGPIAGTLISAFVAPMMLAPRYSVDQTTAAKIIVPTVVAVLALSGLILWVGLPVVLA